MKYNPLDYLNFFFFNYILENEFSRVNSFLWLSELDEISNILCPPTFPGLYSGHRIPHCGFVWIENMYVFFRFSPF